MSEIAPGIEAVPGPPDQLYCFYLDEICSPHRSLNAMLRKRNALQSGFKISKFFFVHKRTNWKDVTIISVATDCERANEQPVFYTTYSSFICRKH